MHYVVNFLVRLQGSEGYPHSQRADLTEVIQNQDLNHISLTPNPMVLTTAHHALHTQPVVWLPQPYFKTLGSLPQIPFFQSPATPLHAPGQNYS